MLSTAKFSTAKFSTARILGLSAVLSAGLVTAFELPSAFATTAPQSFSPAPKAFSERLAPSEAEHGTTIRLPAGSGTPAALRGTDGRLAKSDALAASGCATQTWPNIDPACLSAVDGTPTRQVSRTITIESREAPNVSILTRMPRTTVAQR